MTGGFSDDWWVLLLFPVVLWVPFGPFIMGTLGVWCARRPGWRPRLWSVLVPLEPVGFPVTHTMLPLDALDDPIQRDDFLGVLYVLVLGTTALPWLLGYGITRVTRTLRARRGRV
ncbi:hypothetical protein ACFWDI_17470 [Streptomyces sp. NPDC060064]|uniref:hypothetical protein n=1 Tax=Streptomyces sp. NPDC060064 TaxID=3347049 RepID=UPI0036A4BE0F